MTFVSDASLPLPGMPGMPDSTPAPPAFQMTLIGQPQPVRIAERLWRSWLDDPAVVSRFESKRYRRCPDQCRPWIGGVSSTGHGSFRAASLPGPSRRGTVPAHLFAYQLEYGVISRWGWSNTDDAVLCHQCDFAGCSNPATHAVGNQSQQPQRIRASATQHRQPPRRCSRTRGSHSCHRRRDPYRDRAELGRRHGRRAHRCGRGCRTSALTLVATLPRYRRCTFAENVFCCSAASFAERTT